VERETWNEERLHPNVERLIGVTSIPHRARGRGRPRYVFAAGGLLFSAQFIRSRMYVGGFWAGPMQAVNAAISCSLDRVPR
jgi:hypothetical protein